MKRRHISSSTIVTLGYDAESKTLEVEYPGGGVYRYYEVPPEAYEELMKADSRGNYLNKHIKTSFRCEKIK